MSRRCTWDDCRKWSVPGQKFCGNHQSSSSELEKSAAIAAIKIEKLEQKVLAGEATQEQVIDLQRKSLADSAQRKSFLQISLDEEAQITAGLPGPATTNTSSGAAPGGQQFVFASAMTLEGKKYDLGRLPMSTTVKAVKLAISTVSGISASAHHLYLTEDTRDCEDTEGGEDEVADSVSYRGWLELLVPQTDDEWQRKYFILQDQSLFWYDSEIKTAHEGIVRLDGCKCCKRDPLGTPMPWNIYFSVKNKESVVQLELRGRVDYGYAKKWIEQISTASWVPKVHLVTDKLRLRDHQILNEVLQCVPPASQQLLFSMVQGKQFLAASPSTHVYYATLGVAHGADLKVVEHAYHKQCARIQDTPEYLAGDTTEWDKVVSSYKTIGVLVEAEAKWAEEYEEVEVLLTRGSSGLGLSIEDAGGEPPLNTLIVTGLRDGKPAAESCMIEVGDVLAEVDGTVVLGVNFDKCVELLIGDGTKSTIDLTFLRQLKEVKMQKAKEKEEELARKERERQERQEQEKREMQKQKQLLREDAERNKESLSAETVAKVAKIFAKYDRDGDRFLDLAEMGQLQSDTGLCLAAWTPNAKAEVFSTLCQFVQANPDEGVTVDNLLLAYAATDTDGGNKLYSYPSLSLYNVCLLPTWISIRMTENYGYRQPSRNIESEQKGIDADYARIFSEEAGGGYDPRRAAAWRRYWQGVEAHPPAV
jgi:hypothetical protein